MDITKDTSVEEALKGHPALTKVFIDLGLPCFVCGEAFWGTVEELARQNNIDASELVNKLNKKIKEYNDKV